MTRLMLRVEQTDGRPVVVHDPAAWTILQVEVEQGRYAALPDGMTLEQVREHAGRVEVLADGGQPQVLAVFPSLHDWEIKGAGTHRTFFRLPAWLVRLVEKVSRQAEETGHKGGKQGLVYDLLLAVLRMGQSPLRVCLRVRLDDDRTVVIRDPYDGCNVMQEEMAGGQYRDLNADERPSVELALRSRPFDICADTVPLLVLTEWSDWPAGKVLQGLAPTLSRWLVYVLEQQKSSTGLSRDKLVEGWLVRALYLQNVPDGGSTALGENDRVTRTSRVVGIRKLTPASGG